MNVLAAIPAWNEAPDTLAGALESLQDVTRVEVFAGGMLTLGTGPWASQAEMRSHGLELARQHGAEWLLQIDADERLRNGALLLPVLSGWEFPAYPLPLLQEDGSLLLAPFKLLRTRGLEIVAGCEYVRWDGGETRCLAGYMAPEHLRAALLALPYLEHLPSARPAGRREERLSVDEHLLEPRPEARLWPLPNLTLSAGTPALPSIEMEEGTVTENGGGAYYCPQCGRRFDSPGICEGGEFTHAPANVEPVEPAPDAAGVPDADKPADPAEFDPNEPQPDPVWPS